MDEPFFVPAPIGGDRARPTGPPAWAGSIRRLPVIVSFGAPDTETENDPGPASPAPAAEVRPGWVFAHNESSLVEVVSLDAYAEGIELWVRGSSRADDLQLRRGVDLDPFGRRGLMVGQDRAQIPATLLRVGVRYSDGRRATNIDWGGPPGGPSLWPLGGGSSGGRHDQGFWISPLPQDGGLTLLCEWPAAGIALRSEEIGAEELMAAVERSAELFPRDGRVQRDGRSWRLGTSEAVEWIRSHLHADSDVAAAIPPGFTAYAALEPVDRTRAQERPDDERLVALLADAGGSGPWWLGFLDTGAADVVFPFAPRAEVFPGHGYVLVEAGPAQAIGWREEGNNGALPDLIFPADRSWLYHFTWDHEEAFIGGSESLIAGLEADQFIGPRVRRTQR